MLILHLLRVRCEPVEQSSFFDEKRDPSDVIVDAIMSTPTAVVGRNSEWHIGKPEKVETTSVGFKMGRSTAVTVPQYDSESHDFFESEVKSAPYTFGLFDRETQACGIIKKAGVSQSANEISSKLQTLLNATPFPSASGFRVVVDPIPDPEGFIEQLRTASAITKFSFSASFSNPFDVEALIQRPAEEFTNAVGGDRTKIEVQGENLNEEILEELARGVASTGDEAAATVRQEGSSRGKRIYLRGNPVQGDVEEQQTPKQLYAAMRQATRAAYNRVRNAFR